MSARRPGDGKQRLFSIPPGTPFLPAFAKALLEGRLVEGFPGSPSDPLALANATIYVPTRRAARALRSILVDRNPAKSAILPTIKPLGDVDEDAAFFNAGSSGVFDINPPIGTAERLLLLARLIRPWRESLPSHVRALSVLTTFRFRQRLPMQSGLPAIWRG